MEEVAKAPARRGRPPKRESGSMPTVVRSHNYRASVKRQERALVIGWCMANAELKAIYKANGETYPVSVEETLVAVRILGADLVDDLLAKGRLPDFVTPRNDF